MPAAAPARSIALVTATRNQNHAAGSVYLRGWVNTPAPVDAALTAAANVHTIEADDATFLIVPIELPIKLLVLGAGPDAMPLVEIAGLMGWHVTVLDHRPAYAIADHFPRAHHVALNAANDAGEFMRTAAYDAAVVMSHHLRRAALSLCAGRFSIPYIGLLGPAPRRARLMHEIGEKALLLRARLYAAHRTRYRRANARDHCTRHRGGDPGGAGSTLGRFFQRSTTARNAPGEKNNTVGAIRTPLLRLVIASLFLPA